LVDLFLLSLRSLFLCLWEILTCDFIVLSFIFLIWSPHNFGLKNNLANQHNEISLILAINGMLPEVKITYHFTSVRMDRIKKKNTITRVVNRSGRDETIWVVIHIRMLTTLGISLYSYLYFKPAKMVFFLILLMIFPQRNWKTTG
jgi:hypothetical protein